MNRQETNQGLKIGLLSIVVLAVLAMAAQKVIEYISPIPSSSAYSEFVMSTELTNTFSSAFGMLKDGLEAEGFDVKPHSVSSNDLRFEFELGSAGGAEGLQSILIRRDSLAGTVLHWTESIQTDSENSLRNATIRHDLLGTQASGMHYKDLEAFERVLDEVLEAYRSKAD